MKLIIHYQSERKPIDCIIYYPEDGRTPKQRLEYMKSLKESGTLIGDFIVVSACPYIIEGFVKIFGAEAEDVQTFIDNKEVKLNDIFKELSDPMTELIFM